MKGRTGNPLIQQLITHGSKQKPIDLFVNRLFTNSSANPEDQTQGEYNSEIAPMQVLQLALIQKSLFQVHW